jgi:signal transduction histidine kinase
MVRLPAAPYGEPVMPRLRAAAHLLAGGVIAGLAGLPLLVLPISLGLSLASEISRIPDRNNWLDTVLYVLCVLTSPVWIGWSVWVLTRMQLARFRGVLGVELSEPARAGWARYWARASTWRQLGYHLAGLVTGGLGAAAVLAWLGCVIWVRPWWVALPVSVALLAAVPWPTRIGAELDVRLGRRLLGESRPEQLARRVAALTRSRAEIVAATDAERRRIERDLHDGAQQRLVSLAMNLGMARTSLTDLPEPARQVIADAHEEAKQALAELRNLVRGLHPAVLNDRGLDAALSGLAARSPVPVHLQVDLPERCSPTIEAVAYFVVSEALTNVAKHAEANQVEVGVGVARGRLCLTITDDGRGGAPTVPEPGTGLRGLAQRVGAVDGTLRIASPPGGPTTLEAELPCGL